MRILILVASLGLLARPSVAQEAPPLSVGQRVWVRSRTVSGALDAGIKGMLESLTADSIQVRAKAGTPAVSLGMSPQTRLFVVTGRRSSTGRGAAIGAGVGALAGAVIGFAGGEDCSADQWLCFDRGTVAAGGALALGGVGLVAGIIVGAFSSHDVWSQAGWPGAVRPVVASSPRGVGAGFFLAF
jgi:hypothetical protein